jgi:ParB/RepB/Spo0J family partition protein
MKTIEKTQDKPVLIALSQLHPHPDNPRVFLQDKTYHEIVEALKVDGFKPEYAGIARPIEGGYQIISGHRRRLASQEAGLESMYIWIREMTDEEAFFQLVKENMKQKELTIIDLGFHVLKYEQQCRERGEPTNTQQYVRYAEHIGCSVSRQYCQRAVKKL